MLFFFEFILSFCQYASFCVSFGKNFIIRGWKLQTHIFSDLFSDGVNSNSFFVFEC